MASSPPNLASAADDLRPEQDAVVEVETRFLPAQLERDARSFRAIVTKPLDVAPVATPDRFKVGVVEVLQVVGEVGRATVLRLVVAREALDPEDLRRAARRDLPI